MKRTFRSFLPQPLKDAYYIGILKEDEMSLPIVERYAKVKWLDIRKYKKEGWFADPFIVSVNDNIIELFAEEMIYKTGRGIIVYLKVDISTCEIIEKHTMLELDTHLSFPIYIWDKGKLYVYPENYQSGTLKMYEYDETSKCLTHPCTLIEAPLLDTQIVNYEGVYYAFGVIYQTGLQKDTKKLFVYRADALFGNYKLIQVIENSRCEERGAGLIHIQDGRLIRPAQSCEGRYGKEVILYNLQTCSAGFCEVEIDRVIPDRKAPNGTILHTYNKMDGWVIIDGWRYHYPRIASWYKKIRGIDLE